MRIGPKYKIARRLGANIFDKTAGPKFSLHLARKKSPTKEGFSPLSDFGKALLEKQRVRFYYGISERQFRRFAISVIKHKAGGNQAEILYQKLETRLDNVIYLLGWAPSRQAARQIVSHGHIRVNGKRVDVPSYNLAINDLISIRPASLRKAIFLNVADKIKEKKKDKSFPAWLEINEKDLSARMASLPQLKTGTLPFDLLPVLEFYKR
jgi:small subunit ribosomal protein S4